MFLFTAAKGCPLPMSPEHGRLSCETPGSSEGSDMTGSGDMLEEGSVCRYECDPGYMVPVSQSHLSVIRCRSHSWNSTTDPSCQGTYTFYSFRGLGIKSTIFSLTFK